MVIIIGPSIAWDRWVLDCLDGMEELKTFRRTVTTFLTLLGMNSNLFKVRSPG